MNSCVAEKMILDAINECSVCEKRERCVTAYYLTTVVEKLIEFWETNSRVNEVLEEYASMLKGKK